MKTKELKCLAHIWDSEELNPHCHVCGILMRDDKEPKEGWHWSYCKLCGKKVARVNHFGGKKKLKKCKWCQEGLSVCMDCYVE